MTRGKALCLWMLLFILPPLVIVVGCAWATGGELSMGFLLFVLGVTLPPYGVLAALALRRLAVRKHVAMENLLIYVSVGIAGLIVLLAVVLQLLHRH